MHEGTTLNVATLDAEPGSRVELRDILLVSNGGNVTVGSPTVDGAVVVAEVVEHGKGRKVINFKFKAKTRYRRKRGHRQGFTTLSIREITAGGVTVTAPERAQRAAEPTAPALDESTRPAGFSGRVEDEVPAAEATAEAPEAEAPEAEAPAPRRRTRASSQTESADAGESTEGAPRPRRRRTQGSEPAGDATEEKPQE